MKKLVFLLVIFVLALGAGCKKKVEPVVPPPPPPPVVKVTQQDFIKGLISMIPQLESGEVIPVQVDKEKVISEESIFNVSLFPLDFIYPEGKNYILKYMFPSVVWPGDGFQLPVVDPENLITCSEPGETIRIEKESPKGTPPFENIPTLLVEASEGKFWVLNQNGDEMPLRANWGK
jgi:hypothetical protein